NKLDAITITANNGIYNGAFAGNPLYDVVVEVKTQEGRKEIVTTDLYQFVNDFFFRAYSANSRRAGLYRFDGRYWTPQGAAE
ncbi:MAG: hypothetical protein LBE02_08850, partial [Spirochaetaceae bacterium]|nr:hypothetical protein [Spirochaetaceae bacterium]